MKIGLLEDFRFRAKINCPTMGSIQIIKNEIYKAEGYMNGLIMIGGDWFPITYFISMNTKELYKLDPDCNVEKSEDKEAVAAHNARLIKDIFNGITIGGEV